MTYETEIKKLEKKITALKTRQTKAVISGAKNLRKHATAFAKKHGFKRIEHFLEALGSAPAAAKSVAAVRAVAKRKRANITDDIRKAVAADLKGGKTAKEVAKKHGISLPSVNNIKKHSGLTKSRTAEKKVAPKKAVKVAKKSSKPKKPKAPVAASPVAETPAAATT